MCYRRNDSADTAGRLRDVLVQAFGNESVFFDSYSIGFGRDFKVVILAALEEVEVVLVVIGPGWQPERMADEDDNVRREIEEALRLEKYLIPVLVRNATMPTADVVPSSVADMTDRNSAPLRPDPDFPRDAERLIDQLLALFPIQANPEKSDRVSRSASRRTFASNEVGSYDVTGGLSPISHPQGSVSVRSAEHNGHTIQIETTYRILIDGKEFPDPLHVQDNGTVRYDRFPQYAMPSAMDLLKVVVDHMADDDDLPPLIGGPSVVRGHGDSEHGGAA